MLSLSKDERYNNLSVGKLLEKMLLQVVYRYNSKRLQTLASEREKTEDTEITKYRQKCEQEVGSFQWTGAVQPRHLCSGRNQV